MGKKHRKNAKRKVRYSWGNGMTLLGVTMVVISLAVVMNIGTSSLKKKDLEYQKRVEHLEQVLEKEQERAVQLEEYRVYVQTKQYVEKVAKEKLGLVNRDEILLKPGE